MKKLLLILTSAILLCACTQKPTETLPTLPPWINQTTVSTAFSVATTTGLKRGINESAKRQATAKLLQYIASQCNAFATAGGDNNPEALATFITHNVPADIQHDYPELISFAVPLVVSGYGTIYKAYGSDAHTLSLWLSWAATGISLGAANFAGN